MAGPYPTNFFKPWIKGSWLQSANMPDFDADAFKVAFYLGSSMGATAPNFDTDVGYSSSTAPFNTVGEATGTSVPNGGVSATIVSGGVNITSGNVVIQFNPVVVGTGATLSSFDQILLYDAQSGKNGLGLFWYQLSTQYSVPDTASQLTVDWQDSPATNTVFYGS